MSSTYDYDVIVIGAGHAGAEAAMAAARLGARTALLTISLDTVGQMSCNPAVGGVAKGQIAREIDALGGIMGRVIDATGIQFRMLNRRKGRAMHSPRAQADKKAYQQEVKRLIEEQPGLDLRQEVVEDLVVEEVGRIVNPSSSVSPAPATHTNPTRKRGSATTDEENLSSASPSLARRASVNEALDGEPHAPFDADSFGRIGNPSYVVRGVAVRGGAVYRAP